MKMLLALSVLVLSLACFAQNGAVLYQNDFQKAELDKIPEDLIVLDGAFAVKEKEGNLFLELPGAPLDTFGVLFGPAEKDGITASARVYATAKGRRFPTFALGLNGTSGYRLQITPAKKALELFRSDTLKTSVPFQWESGKWTHLRLQFRKASAGWKIEGRVWFEGQPEPASWMISAEETEEVPAGRAAVFGSPFSGTPIDFDDLVVARIPNKMP